MNAALFENFKLFTPPSIQELDFFINKIDFIPPQDYFDFIKSYNGGEGSISGGGYIEISPLRDSIEINQLHNTIDLIPDFFIIGSDGAGFAFALHKIKYFYIKFDIYDIPFSIAPYYYGDSFENLLKNVGRYP